MTSVQFEITSIPEGARKSKYGALRQALESAQPGECVKVPLETFGNNTNPQSALNPKAWTARKLRVRRMSDGWYMWLDPEQPNGNGTKGGAA